MTLIDLGCSRYWWILFAMIALVGPLRMRSVVILAGDVEQSLVFVNRITTELVVIHSLPWLTMAIGSTLGGLPLIAFLRAQELNKYVVAFYIVCLMANMLLGYWIWFRGARDFFTIWVRATSPFSVRVWYFVRVGGFLAAIFGLVQINVHLPCENLANRVDSRTWDVGELHDAVHGIPAQPQVIRHCTG